jgi:hypothetical protein
MVYVPYASEIGSLMYFMIYTRLDIAQSMEVLSRFIVNLGCERCTTVKRVFRYLQGTSEYSISYHGDISGDAHSMDI